MSEDIEASMANAWQEVEAERDKLRLQVYMPGTWVCDKCKFEQNNRVLNPNTGEVGVRLLEEVEICPNDGETMRRVTWQEAAQSNYDAAFRFLDERDAARKELEAVRVCFAEASQACSNLGRLEAAARLAVMVLEVCRRTFSEKCEGQHKWPADEINNALAELNKNLVNET